MSDVAKSETARAEAHEKRSAYFSANRGNLDSQMVNHLNDIVEQADRAALAARKAQSDLVGNMSDAEYRDYKNKILNGAEIDAKLRRDRRAWTLR